MSWAKLLADNRVIALASSKAELDNLRSIVARSLKDLTAPGLSADARFTMTYDAARTLALLIVGIPSPHCRRTLQHLFGAGGSRSGLRGSVRLF